MNITSKKLPKSQIELTIEVPFEEIKPYLIKTAEKISIPGFRTGKAPYDIVKTKVGEAKILENAVPDVIKDTLMKAFTQEQLEVIGQPKVDIEKLDMNASLTYKATTSLLPKTKLSDYKSLKTSRKKVECTKKEIDKVLAEIQDYNAKELISEKSLEPNDKAELDLEMFLGNVPLEGGSLKKQKIIVGKEIFPEEFNKNLTGLKKGDEKEFSVEYPKSHFDKKLAGKTIKFKVKIDNVYERILPEINDEFAKMQGLETLKKLREHVENIIIDDKKHKEEDRVEGEILEKLISNTEFEEMPDILIDAETEKMLEELETNIASQGGVFSDYLSHIKKTKEELKKEFLPMAEKRVKTALAMRNIAELEKIQIESEELEKEINKILANYENNSEIERNIKSEGYKNYLKNILLNKKIIEKLKEWNITE